MFSVAHTVFLMDNGSLRPEAILQLRSLAREVGRKLRRPVLPVSMAHADRVPARKLRGERAETVEAALRERAETGERAFAIVPLYLGPSASLMKTIPSIARRLRTDFPGLRVVVARPLGYRRAYDLQKILGGLVRRKLRDSFPVRCRPKIVLVDHGSPSPAVGRTRSHLAARIRDELGRRIEAVEVSSMERRPGPRYAFNEPLFEDVLKQPPFDSGPARVIVAPMFILPGRHAGSDGDIEQMCRRAQERNPALELVRTELIGTHPRLVDLLAMRYREAIRNLRRGA